MWTLNKKDGPSGPYKVVAFDFDGTILRGKGFKYSWKRIWRYLGYNDNLRKSLFRKYLDNEISYKDWCKECLFYFKQKKLHRNQFKDIVRGLRVTKNLYEAIECLKHNNITTAIISGGVDTFIAESIKDYDILFDYIFINKFEFDERGFLSNIIPTKYDFYGKIKGLEEICKRRGVDLSSAVFVGEGKNDAYIISEMRKRNKGLTIAYPPNSTEVEIRAHIEIRQNDLMQIIPYILG